MNYIDFRGAESTNKKFPNKFQYQQDYPWFIVKIFNVNPPVIPDKDKK